MQTIKLLEPIANKKRVAFSAVDPQNLDTRLDSATINALIFSIHIVKADGTVVAGQGTGGVDNGGSRGVTLPDGVNAKAVCFYTPGGTDLDTAGPIVFKIEAAGMAPREVSAVVEDSTLTAAVNGTLTASAFSCDRGEGTDNYWRDALVRARDGANAGQVKKIGAYNGATKVITLATIAGVQQAFTSAPANGDHFEIITR